MNWSQAMKAMVEGQKVRFIEWHPARWVSAEKSDSMGSYTFEELQAMEWEVYEEPALDHDAILDILTTAMGQAHSSIESIFSEVMDKLLKMKIG